LRCLCFVLPSSPWLVFHGVYYPTAPSLRPLVPSGSLIWRQSVQVYHILLFCSVQAKGSGLVNAPISVALKLLLIVSSFIWGGGGGGLHNLLTLIFRCIMEVMAILFAISSPRVSQKVLLRFPMFSSCSCCLLLHPLMLFLVALFFLRCSCSLTSWSHIPLLPS
jgi:hypothetical protein